VTCLSQWAAALAEGQAWTAVPAGSPDLTAVAARLGLSPRFVAEMAQGSAHLERLRRAEVEARCPTIDLARASERFVDVAYALTYGAKLFLCPFSGEWRQTDKSVGTEAFFGQHEDRCCLILQYCIASAPRADTAFAFPAERVVVFFEPLVRREQVLGRLGELFAAMAENGDVVDRHLSAAGGARPVAVAEMRVPHFGHFIWNALSAWGYLLPHYAGKIDLFISWAESRFIGRVTDIYAEVADRESIVVGDEVAMVRAICERRAFTVFAKDQYVLDGVAHRVTGYARRACPESSFRKLEELRRGCRIVVLFALRTGNRVWLGQEAGFVALAAALVAEFGSCGFVIDGMNRDTSRGWTHGLMSMGEEAELADRLVPRLAAFAPCFSTVGATVVESLVASDVCDAFVAPAGSGLAKYKWIANKPGVVMANSVVLNRKDPRGEAVRVFEHARENLHPSRFVPADAVTDIPAPERPGVPHANFHLDWTVVFNTLVALLREPQTGGER
jgi:hypothetical protein